MKRELCLAVLMCMVLTLAGRGAETPAAAGALPESAGDTAVRLAAAYAASLQDLDAALKSNDLSRARAAGDALLALADTPVPPGFRGRPPWKARIPALQDLIGKFQQKRLFGADETCRYFEQLLGTLEGRERELQAIRYATFRYTYALGDDAELLAVIDTAIASPLLKPADRVKACLERAGLCDFSDYEAYQERALAAAADDADLRATVYRAGFNTERARGTAAVLGDLRAAMADPVLKPRLLAAGRGHAAAFARQIVASLNRLKRYDEGLAFLEACVTSAPPAEVSLASELMAGIHLLKARRYYAAESPLELERALACCTRAIDTLPDDDPAGLMTRLLLRMDVAGRLNRRAQVEADAARLETRLADRREQWAGEAGYLRGLAAYQAGAYADARARFGAIPLEKVHKRRKIRILDCLIRSCCALGDYEAALAYRPAFEETNRNWGDLSYTMRGEGFDTERYAAFFRSLEIQAARAKAVK